MIERLDNWSIVTHEEDFDDSTWPHSHVGVTLTGDDVLECFSVTVHGVTHYLHATTAHELFIKLHNTLHTFNTRNRNAGLPELNLARTHSWTPEDGFTG